MESNNYARTVSKKQLAKLMNISNTSLRLYLNIEWYDELKALGYDKNNKVLSPRQIMLIQSKWGKLDFNLLKMKVSY
jgi:hypothetical protein